MTQSPAYDAIAGWYEQYISGAASDYSSRVHAMLRDLIGEGSGACLDLCCGTGARAGILRELGWTPFGIDLSAGQLGYTAGRLPAVLGTADRLPAASGSVSAVACVLAHTDMPAYAAALREASRVLEPGGRFVHVGVHPCFVGAFADRSDPARLVIDDRYADRSRSFDAWSPHGVRARVGAWHVPLTDLLNGVTAAGLRVIRTAESGPAGIPDLFGLLAVSMSGLSGSSGSALGSPCLGPGAEVRALALPAEQAEELDWFGVDGAEPVRYAGVELGRFTG
jgi:SAM-dependent methyltransferase